MAEKLADYEFSTRTGRNKYPYDEWFDGSVWKISRPDDYAIQEESMTVNLYTQARNRGHKVRSTVGDGYIIFQAYELPEPATNGDQPVD